MHAKPSTGAVPTHFAAYPRYSGFYMWAYANAYVQTRDPKFINRAEVLIESRTGRRPQPFSLLVDPGGFQPEHSLDPVLRLMLWDAAALVPELRDAWRAIVRELDEEDLAKTRTILPASREAPNGSMLSPIWRMAYGSSGVSGRALMNLTRYYQTRDRRFLKRAGEVADRFLEEGIPPVKKDLWPCAAGQVISLLVTLSRESTTPAESARRYLAFAREVADMSLDLFSRSGLFRADGASQHYEAITGADDLLWWLLQLHCAMMIEPRQLGHNDVNM